MKAEHPNPAGKAGKPFTLAPMKFDDALRKKSSPSKGINPVQHSEGKAAAAAKAKSEKKPAKKKPKVKR